MSQAFTLYSAAVLFAACFVLGLFLTWAYVKVALKAHWFDQPNERSSHVSATPSGAGIALALGWLLAVALYLFAVDQATVLQFTIAVTLFAALGWMDDRFHLSRRLRALAFLTFSAVVAVQMLPSSPLVVVLAAVFMFAWVNMYNFMDGIDGIAASEALFICLASMFLIPVHSELLDWYAMLAGLLAGFLVWNWSPAKVFMGDAGSLFIGFLLVILAYSAEARGMLAIESSLILMAAFISDALVVLVMRSLNGEVVFDAHRSHVYQLLAQRWASHGRVVAAFMLVNITFLLPAAWLAQVRPDTGAILVIAVYVILCLLCTVLRRRLLMQ